MKRRAIVLFLLVFLLVFNDHLASGKTRNKRQIGRLIRLTVRAVQRNLRRGAATFEHNLERHITPGVQHATEYVVDNVVPTLANTLLGITNQVVLQTAEGLQNGAILMKDKVVPAVEDTVVEISNAAVPVVNKGIEVVETGLQKGVSLVSEKTSEGIQVIGKKVLGEQRHSRIKKIADNISTNVNNNMNNLANAIKRVTKEDSYSHPISQSSNNLPPDSRTNLPPGQRDQGTFSAPYPTHFSPHSPSIDYYYDINLDDSDYQATNINYFNKDSQTEDDKELTLPQALGKMVSNTAYAISKQFLGANLTDAVAPIARSVTNAIGNSIPSAVAGGNQVQEIRVPEKIRTCTTPDRRDGYCQSLKECPKLVMRMSQMRKSFCLKGIIDVGICCPDVGQMKSLLRDTQSSPASSAAFQRPTPQQTGRPLVAPNSPGYLQRPGGQFIQGFPALLPHPAYQGAFIHPSLGAVQPGVPNVGHPGVVPTHPGAAQPAIHHQASLASSQPQLTSTPYNSKISSDNVIINSHKRNRAFKCGVQQVPSFRVVGGEQSHIGEWPWMAAIYLNGPKKTEFWCGGALISEQYVVTAAHCTKDANGKTFDASQFTVHLGDNNIASKHDDKTSDPVEYNVRYIIPHNDFKKNGFFNDIALLKLTREVDFSQYILPVCLPSQSMQRSALDSLVGQTPTVIGYGSTKYDGPHSNALRDTKLPVWTNRDCDKAYFQPITETFICAGYSEGGKDACQGDSGGPLQLYKNGRWHLIGLVSFGNRCAEPGYPGVYSRITKYIPWIRQNMT